MWECESDSLKDAKIRKSKHKVMTKHVDDQANKKSIKA